VRDLASAHSTEKEKIGAAISIFYLLLATDSGCQIFEIYSTTLLEDSMTRMTTKISDQSVATHLGDVVVNQKNRKNEIPFVNYGTMMSRLN